IKSVLTHSALYALCERFHIPDLVHPELPGHSDKILNSPVGRIDVYSMFFYFANYRVPLSQFLVDILDYFQINLSRLSVITAAKVVSAVFPLNISLHRSKSLRKDPHPTPVEFNADMCNFLADNPALFWKLLEPFLSFIGISGYYDLDGNYYLTFWDDEDHDGCSSCSSIGERKVRDEEVSLLKLTKDRIVPLAGVYDCRNTNAQDAGNENVNEGVNDAATAGHTEQSDHVVDVEGIDIIVDDEIQVIVAEQPKKIRQKRMAADGAGGSSLPPKNSSTLVAKVRVKAAATVPFVTSFVTSTPEREGGSARDSATGTMLPTQRASERFVVLTDSSHHSGTNAADDEVTSIVKSSMPPPFMLTVAVTTTTVITGTTSALVYDLGTDQVKPSIFRDSASPSMAEADLVGSSQPVEELLVDFSMGSSRQTCFNAEIRIRLEHELRGKQKLEEICIEQVNWLKKKDTEIASLKAQLYLKKAKAVEAIRLRGQIATLETAEAARINELNDLRKRNVALVEHVTALEAAAVSKDAELASSNSQVSALETKCSGLRDEVIGYKLFKERVEEMQDEQVKALSDRVAAIDSDLMGMALHMDEEFYPCYLKTIAGRRWILNRCLRLVIMKCLQSSEYLSALGGAIGRAINKGMHDGLAAGINHEKAGRGLADVAAFNPSVESNFVSAMNALGEVDFPILAQLSSLKDASIMDLMDALRLEGSTAKTPGATQLQSVRGLASAIPVTEAHGLVLSMEAPSPSQIVFEKEDMETMHEHASVD
nr:transposase (putative), gypsy type [Tanacetum cinerariifolium]